MQASSKRSVPAANNTTGMSTGPPVRWAETAAADSQQQRHPPQRSVVDLLRPSQKSSQQNTFSHAPVQPARVQPPIEEVDDESAVQAGSEEEDEGSEAAAAEEEEEESEEESQDGEGDCVEEAKEALGAEIPSTPSTAAAVPSHGPTAVPMPTPAAATTTKAVTSLEPAPSSCFALQEHAKSSFTPAAATTAQPVAAPPRPAPAEKQTTTPTHTEEPTETPQWSEQARRLQQWEAELRERERRLLEYKDSLSRPVGAKLPPRSPAASTTVGRLSDYYSSSETTADTAAQEDYVYPYDRTRYDSPAAGTRAPVSSRQPDIHIHNHLPPPAVPSPAAQWARDSWESITAGAGEEKVRFPYDRRVDYDSATGYPSSSVPSVYDATSAIDRTSTKAPQAPPRTVYQVDYSATQPALTAATTKNTTSGASFEDRHELFARVSCEFPSWRDSASHRASSSTQQQQSEVDGEEVNLSGLSLQRMRELTGHY